MNAANSGAAPATLDAEALRSLAAVRAARGGVVSVYVDVEPEVFSIPARRATLVGSLRDGADKEFEKRKADLDHDARKQLAADIKRTFDHLGSDKLQTDHSHGLAVFCSGSAGLFEIIPLPRSAGSSLTIDDRAHLAPLVEAARQHSWMVALVNRRDARFLRGTESYLREAGGLSDDVHGWHDKGGMSQKRYQRGIEKEAEDHFRHVAAELADRRRRRGGFDRLLIAGPHEQMTTVEAMLASDVRERLAGIFDVDVHNSTPDEVLAAARPAMEADATKRERELLDRLAAGVEGGGRAAAGLDEVLAALNEQRVDTLLLDPAFEGDVAQCPKCGWLGEPTTERCPTDDTPLRDGRTAADAAVESALAQSAAIETIRGHDDVAARGGIGALLRY